MGKKKNHAATMNANAPKKTSGTTAVTDSNGTVPQNGPIVKHGPENDQVDRHSRSGFSLDEYLRDGTPKAADLDMVVAMARRMKGEE